MNRLRELTAELGFMPATTDGPDIDRHRLLNKLWLTTCRGSADTRQRALPWGDKYGVNKKIEDINTSLRVSE